MNLHERAACDGLLPDEDTPISAHMDWMREHVERLAWELESTSRALTEATAMLRKLEGEL
jgi:hypothetical protein